MHYVNSSIMQLYGFFCQYPLSLSCSHLRKINCLMLFWMYFFFSMQAHLYNRPFFVTYSRPWSYDNSPETRKESCLKRPCLIRVATCKAAFFALGLAPVGQLGLPRSLPRLQGQQCLSNPSEVYIYCIFVLCIVVLFRCVCVEVFTVVIALCVCKHLGHDDDQEISLINVNSDNLLRTRKVRLFYLMDVSVILYLCFFLYCYSSCVQCVRMCVSTLRILNIS